MSADKYPGIFSRQMKAIVYLLIKYIKISETSSIMMVYNEYLSFEQLKQIASRRSKKFHKTIDS